MGSNRKHKRTIDLVWGDTGQGGVASRLLELGHYDLVVRSAAAPSSGRQSMVGNSKVALHQLSAGVFRGLFALLTRSSLIDFEELREEFATVTGTMRKHTGDRKWTVPTIFIDTACGDIMEKHRQASAAAGEAACAHRSSTYRGLREAAMGLVGRGGKGGEPACQLLRDECFIDTYEARRMVEDAKHCLVEGWVD